MTRRASTLVDPGAIPHVVNEDGFAQIPQALLYDPAISAAAVRVYGVLRRHGDDPLNCFPSHARIAAFIGASSRSVPAWIRELEDAGWIERVPRWRSGETITTTRPEFLGGHEGWEVASNAYKVFGRVRERGVRAQERGGSALENGEDSAPGSAQKESKLEGEQENELRGERGRPLIDVLFDDPQAGDESVDKRDARAEFEMFWSAYPVKSDKGDARKAWPTAVAKAKPSTLIEAARRYAADPNREDRFTKRAGRWLRAEAWLNGPEPDRGRRGAAAKLLGPDSYEDAVLDKAAIREMLG